MTSKKLVLEAIDATELATVTGGFYFGFGKPPAPQVTVVNQPYIPEKTFNSLYRKAQRMAQSEDLNIKSEGYFLARRIGAPFN
jgi:hypothetical protein